MLSSLTLNVTSGGRQACIITCITPSTPEQASYAHSKPIHDCFKAIQSTAGPQLSHAHIVNQSTNQSINQSINVVHVVSCACCCLLLPAAQWWLWGADDSCWRGELGGGGGAGCCCPQGQEEEAEAECEGAQVVRQVGGGHG